MRRKTNSLAVVDASAVLAFVHRERGYEVVRPILHRAAISTVNLEEVLLKMSRKHIDPTVLASELKKRGLRAWPYTEEDALASTSIDAKVQKRGLLSLGDRACLALGLRLAVPVYTADRLWNQLELHLEIRTIR